MQKFIATGRVSKINPDAFSKTANQTSHFKFDFVCETSMKDDYDKPIPFFVPVHTYGKQAEFLQQYLTQGRQILVQGELINRCYQDEQGRTKYYLFLSPDKFKGVELLGPKPDSSNQSSVSTQPTPFEPSPAAVSDALPDDSNFPF